MILKMGNKKKKIMREFLLKCPKCNNFMKYHTSGNLDKKRKRCVYCGHSFLVKKAVVDLKGLKNKNF